MGSGHQGELLSRQSRGLFDVQETAHRLAERRQGHRAWGEGGLQRTAPADGTPGSVPLPARDPRQAPNSPTRPRPRCGCPSITQDLRTQTEQSYTASQDKSHPSRADYSATSRSSPGLTPSVPVQWSEASSCNLVPTGPISVPPPRLCCPPLQISPPCPPEHPFQS